MSKDEFYKKLELTKKKINYLSFINVDTAKYNDMIYKLENNINKKDEEANDKYTQPVLDLMLENLYKNALLRLRIIECEFIKYNNYLDTCLLIEEISYVANNKDISKKELNDLVNKTINVIESNNNLDSVTLNNLYSLCFKLMQLEISINSKSKILTYSKNNKKLRIYIKKRIEEEILMSDKVSPSECNTAKEIIKSNNDKIVTEENISDITNDKIKDEVMNELKSFLRQIAKNNKEMESLPNKKSKHNPIVVSAVTYASILAVAFSVVKLSHDKSVSHEYLTERIIVTSDKTIEDEKYLPLIKDGYQELVVESYPWTDLGNGKSIKKEISYDVTNSDINKENYETKNLTGYKTTSSERQISSKSININLNDDIERSFVILNQDTDDEKTKIDGLTFYIYMFLGSLSGIFGLLLAGCAYEKITGEYIKDLTKEAYRRIKNGEITLEEDERVKKYSKRYLKLIKENDEIKKRFMENYNKYCEIVNLDELKKEYNRVMK